MLFQRCRIEIHIILSLFCVFGVLAKLAFGRYACFIDFHKTFDRIRHEIMLETLANPKMCGKEMKIIKNFYWNQIAIKIGEEERTEEVNTRGVRQGCIVSPFLFNTSDKALKKKNEI